jgi:hypothetical protein
MSLLPYNNIPKNPKAFWLYQFPFKKIRIVIYFNFLKGNIWPLGIENFHIYVYMEQTKVEQALHGLFHSIKWVVNSSDQY